MTADVNFSSPQPTKRWKRYFEETLSSQGAPLVKNKNIYYISSFEVSEAYPPCGISLYTNIYICSYIYCACIYVWIYVFRLQAQVNLFIFLAACLTHLYTRQSHNTFFFFAIVAGCFPCSFASFPQTFPFLTFGDRNFILLWCWLYFCDWPNAKMLNVDVPPV